MKKLIAMFVMSITMMSTYANARTAVPIINHPNITITTSDAKALQTEQVKQAITAAAVSKGWTVAAPEAGTILATLLVRNKHTVVVKIDYDTRQYSIHYHDSKNMKYQIIDVQKTIASFGADTSLNGQGEIHPFYNRWVQDLKEAIQAELLKL